MEFEDYSKIERYVPDFDVRETRDSTEELPVLALHYAGVTFLAKLDILAYTVSVELASVDTDTDPNEVTRLEPYAKTIAQTELNQRREKYSEYFA